VSQVVAPAPRDVWQRVLAADPNALVSQSPAWLDCICATGAYEDASRLYMLGGARPIVLPLVRRAGAHGVEALGVEASPPHAWGMGGIVAPGGAGPADVAAVCADLGARRVLRTLVRPDPLQGPLWAAARPRATAVARTAHVLELAGGFDEVWRSRFTGEARTAVRKAERAGLEVVCDTTGALVPVFYRLFRLSLDRWASRQHEPRSLARRRGRNRDPLEKFELLARRLGDACRLWVASAGGEPAAAILVFQGANASYTRGAMDPRLAGPTRANYLLHRLAIEDACAAGCRRYHMGETGSAAGLAQFKTRFGARAHPYAEYSFERLPVTSIDQGLRRAAKVALGFRDDA
jgi:hypothetical protein